MPRKTNLLLHYPWLLAPAYVYSVEGLDPTPENISLVLGIPKRLAKSLSYYYRRMGLPSEACIKRIGKVIIGVTSGFLVYAILRRRSVRSGKIPLYVASRDTMGEAIGDLPSPLKSRIGEIRRFILECRSSRHS